MVLVYVFCFSHIENPTMTGKAAIKTNIILRTLIRVLPSRVRRATLLASFAGAMQGVRPEDQQAIHTLNQILHLATYESSLCLPIHVSSLIWYDSEVVKQDITAIQADGAEVDTLMAIRDIVNKIPSWFRYGTSDDMVSDFRDLVKINIGSVDQMAVA